ncbi:MAG: hypothetical protein A2Y38_08805 [Spirochaetes bacterium GWB1_59_5]|nr:MAG: hypothetical protein A2Y38_08805 [Spirochaetes bacterium GWB1_59_5]
MAIDKKGALALTANLDNLASVIQIKYAALGITERIAKDFAYRCDLLSDHIERTAGLKRQALTGDDPVLEPGFNPELISEEKAGPLEQDADEKYMDQEFTQQEKRELRESVEGGEIGPDKTKDEEQAPRAGIQASLDLGDAAIAVQASSKGATGELATSLGAMGTSLLKLQAKVLQGQAPATKAAKVVEAASRLIPHLAVITPETAPKLARMASIVTKLANA